MFIIPNEVHTDNPETLNTFLKGLDIFIIIFNVKFSKRKTSESVKNLPESDERYFYNLLDCKKVSRVMIVDST